MSKIFTLIDKNLTHANPNYQVYTIPNDVLNIADGTADDYAFIDVSKQTQTFEVTFAKNSKLVYIGNYSFYKCSQLTKIDFTNAVNLKYIGKLAFCGCGIESLDFTQNSKLESILGYGTFQECKKLISVKFPDNSPIYFIGGGVFRFTALTSFRVPKNCQYVDGETFGHSPILEFTVEKGNSYFNTYKGSLYSYDYKKLVCYCHKDNFELHPNTTSIGWLAFEGFPYSITIPNQVTSFNQKSFLGFRGSSISIMSPIENVFTEMFRDCLNLRFLYFFDKITSIENGAFNGSINIQYVFFLKPVTSIHMNAFPNPETICFAGAVDSVRNCLPNISIRECKLTIQNLVITANYKQCFYFRNLSPFIITLSYM